MLQRCRSFWENLSIRYKAPVLCGILLLPALLLGIVTTNEFYSYRAQTDNILLGYARCITFAKNFEVESALLDQFVYPAPAQKSFNAFSEAHTAASVSWRALSETAQYDNRSIALLRHSIAQSISHYWQELDDFLEDLQDGSFDGERFAALQAQAGYLSGYINELIELLLLQGQESYQEVIHRATIYNGILFAAVIVSMLVLAIGMALMVGNISRPVRRLSEAAQRMEYNDYDSPVADTGRGDELGQLARAFSAMQARVRETIHALEAEARLEKELRLHEAEEARLTQEAEKSRFAQLQSQINPHFLFNTLQSIAMMAELEQAAVASNMTVRLANFFRYTLENDDAVVTLARELDLLRDYVSLQEMRFSERLTVEMECDTSCDSALVPKFLLQPLVENAIVHGMRQRTAGGRIRVTTRRHADGVVVVISDNGCGFDRRAARVPREGRHSIGVGNIAERVAMLGGSFYLFSMPGWGTAARICIRSIEEAKPC